MRLVWTREIPDNPLTSLHFSFFLLPVFKTEMTCLNSMAFPYLILTEIPMGWTFSGDKTVKAGGRRGSPASCLSQSGLELSSTVAIGPQTAATSERCAQPPAWHWHDGWRGAEHELPCHIRAPLHTRGLLAKVRVHPADQMAWVNPCLFCQVPVPVPAKKSSLPRETEGRTKCPHCLPDE